jgi:hypothetical protein
MQRSHERRPRYSSSPPPPKRDHGTVDDVQDFWRLTGMHVVAVFVQDDIAHIVGAAFIA